MMRSPAPPSASPSVDAFPRGTYAKYKRATFFFLQWLLRARRGGLGGPSAAPSDTNQPLDVYDEIVAAIAEKPASLAPVLLQKWPRALEACESAITLRERVALFFGDAADDAHAHFLTKLQSWFRILSTAWDAYTTMTHSVPIQTTNQVDLSNYYEVLALPDDYFPDNDDAGSADNTTGVSSRSTPCLSKADRKKLQGDVVDDDFRTELACMFMELDELSEAVYSVYLDVKSEKKTIVEATVVAKVAIDSAASVIASFQVRHPTLRDGNDLSKFIENEISIEQRSRLVASVQAAWMPSDNPKEVRHQYAPGTVLVDIVCIVDVLSSIAMVKGNLLGSVGERYNESTKRHFVVPVWDSTQPFFSYHLPKLLNMLFYLRAYKAELQDDSMVKWLLDPYDQFCATRTVSIHLVFSCVCWIRSIAALQGDRRLARTISVSYLRLWDLKERLEAPNVVDIGRSLYTEYTEDILKHIQGMDFLSAHMRVNPLLIGCFLLDQHVRYFTFGHDLLAASLFRPFCHIYSALLDRKLLDELPFVEDLIQVYEATVFTPSRAAARHGSFAKSFLATHKLLEANFTFRLSRLAQSRPGQAKSVVEKGRFDYVSDVFRVLYDQDFSILPPTSSLSWSALLSAVADVSKRELFQTRVLSRDVRKLAEDLTDVFSSICAAMDRRAHVNRSARGLNAHLQALETAVIFPLLPWLDTLTETDVSRSVGRTVDVCRRVADIISRKFGNLSQVEEDYFVLPATRAWVSAEFYTPMPSEAKVSVVVEFASLLRMLSASPSPLRGQELREFKRRVIATPSVLTVVEREVDIEHRTLLHHAAAGPAPDLRLAEWLMQMGALDMEMLCYRLPLVHKRQAKGLPRDWLPNEFAIHSAAKKGYREMVFFMLDAGNFRDINMRTLYTKESLAQIAVQTNDEWFWGWLSLHGATNSGVDAAGKHVWDYTADRKWRSELKRLVAMAEQDEETASSEDTNRGVYGKSDAATERDLKLIHDDLLSVLSVPLPSTPKSSQNDTPVSNQAVSDDTPAAQPTGAGKRCKTKKKKKLNKKQATPSTSASDVAPAVQLMNQLFLGTTANNCES